MDLALWIWLFTLGMANSHDSDVVVRDYLVLMKFCHALAGLYIWEFFTTLDYEWSVIRGRRPYRWTIWIHSTTRLSTLVTVVLHLVSLDIAKPTNCQAITIATFVFAYTAFFLSSLLIVLRIVAIWNKKKAIVGFATVLWTANVSLVILGITQIRSAWVPGSNICSIPGMQSNIPTVISVLVTDIVLLLIMLIGLLRLRHRDGGQMFDLGQLLLKQGLIWLLLATAVEIPPTIFLFLDLNDPLNDILLIPALVTISIATTRMYRSLTDFVCSGDIYHYSTREPEGPRTVGRSDGSAKSTTAIPISPEGMEVAMHTVHKQHSASHASESTRYSGTSVDEHLLQKPHIVSLIEDLERGLGN